MEKKLLKYYIYPDLAYKFLLTNVFELQREVKNNYLEFVYNFETFTNFDINALKLIHKIDSITHKKRYNIRKTKKIYLKYKEDKFISTVGIRLSYIECLSFLPYYIIKPFKQDKILNSVLKEGKYYVFPGLPGFIEPDDINNKLNLRVLNKSKMSLFLLTAMFA